MALEDTNGGDTGIVFHNRDQVIRLSNLKGDNGNRYSRDDLSISDNFGSAIFEILSYVFNMLNR